MESYPRQCSDGVNTFTEEIDQPIGGERDEHGCLSAAGYTYDEEVGACLRDWELYESQKKAAKIAVEYVGQDYGLTILDVEVLRCVGCFIVNFEKDQARFSVQLSNWEILEVSYSEDECKNAGGRVTGACEEQEIKLGDIEFTDKVCCALE